MTNAEAFTAAHTLTRETLQDGDDYRVTFAACLKAVYALGELPGGWLYDNRPYRTREIVGLATVSQRNAYYEAFEAIEVNGRPCYVKDHFYVDCEPFTGVLIGMLGTGNDIYNAA